MSAQNAATLPDLAAGAMALHAEQPREAAGLLLRQAPGLLAQGDVDAEGLGRLMRSAEHVLIGHLDDVPGWLHWQVLCEAALRRLALWDGEQDRLAVQLALLAGEPAPLHLLPLVQQVRAHGNVLLALTRRRAFDAAGQLLGAAQALAPNSDPAAQAALAALANNLADDLRFYWRGPDDAAAGLMLDAARCARQAWANVGGWQEGERADWLLAMCAATVGQGALARRHAQACLSTCEAEQADDYEHCFAWQAVALAALASGEPATARAARARMAERLGGVQDPADLAYARRCLAELDGRLAP
jgi:hypothetical protein